MPSNKILVNNPDDVEDVNSTLEAFRSCPSCKRDNAIITDPNQERIFAANVAWWFQISC